MKNLALLAICGIGLVSAANADTVDTLINTGLTEPYAVAVDAANNYYVTDSANNRIVRFNTEANTSVSFSGVGGLAGRGYKDGPNYQALFYNPQGIVYARGGLVVSDSGNQRIRFVGLDGTVSTLAGTNTVGATDGQGVNAQFNFPAGIAADAAGNIYIADLGNNSIRKLDLANNVTTIATNFYRPSAVTVASGGRIFVADTGNH